MISSLRYEWRRITTIRSTYILLACAIIFSVLIGWLTIESLSSLSSAAQNSGEASGDAQQVLGMSFTGLVFSATGNIIILALFATVAAQSFGQEYRQGTIRLTLTAIPFRERVFSAKLVMVVVFVAVGWIIATALTYALMTAIASGKSNITASSLDLGYLGRGLLYVIGFCFIVFGVVVLTRILALGVIIPIVIAAVAEPLLITVLGGSLSAGSGNTPWIEKVLPFHNGNQFVDGSETMMSSGLTYLAWVVVVLLAAWIMFKKRDA